MVFDFIFTKKEILKGEFFQWMIELMIQNGWQNLSANKVNVDDYAMFSTGESGNEKIGVQIKPYYTDEKTRYNFETTDTGYIAARAFYNYEQNPNANSRGTMYPNVAWVEMRPIASANPSQMITAYYHVNKDRLIMVLESPNSDTYSNTSSSFFVFGKPFTIADYDEYCTSAVITSIGNYACRSGYAHWFSDGYQYTSDFRVNNIPKDGYGENKFAHDLIIQNPYDGDKYIVENIFATNLYDDYLNPHMRNDTFVDSEGRVFKLCVNNLTSQLQYANLRSFLIRIG